MSKTSEHDYQDRKPREPRCTCGRRHCDCRTSKSVRRIRHRAERHQVRADLRKAVA